MRYQEERNAMKTSTAPVAVVTAAARRLGATTALTLARHGYDVVVHYHHSASDAERCAAKIRESGREALLVQGDLTLTADVDRLLRATLERFGRADVLVANAGAFQRTPLADLDDAAWNAMLDGNLRTAWLCAQRFGLHMQTRGEGCIVALADVAGLRPWAEFLAYNISKAGVATLVQTLAKELAPAVRVNAVAPGPILFPPDFNEEQKKHEIDRTLLLRAGSPQNVADAILALVQNDYITGVILPVDGGRLLK